MAMKITRCTFLLALVLTAGFVTSTGCAGSDEAHVQAMEREHDGDSPEASPVASTAPSTRVESSEVHYATLEDDPRTEIHGYLARPTIAGSTGAAPGILLVHEWWGLNDNIRSVADRFAGEGYVALAVDLYEGRVADTRDGAAALMRGTFDRTERLNDNLRQARDFLAEQSGASKIGSIGWCSSRGRYFGWLV